MAHKVEEADKKKREEERISFFDRMRLRTNDAEKLMGLIYYEADRPAALQAARKLLEDPEVKSGKGKLSLPERLSFAAKIASSSNEKIANVGLDFIDKNASDEWKLDYNYGLVDKLWVLQIKNTPARMRAWGIFREADMRLNPADYLANTKGGMDKVRMEGVFDELKQAALSGWNSDPIRLFENLGKELEKAGIDEGRFASFMKDEIGKTLPLILRQRVAGVVESDPGKNALKFAMKEGKLAAELLTIARCMEDAAQKGITAENYFGSMGGGIARMVVGSNRNKVIDEIKDLVVEMENREENGRRGSKS